MAVDSHPIFTPPVSVSTLGARQSVGVVLLAPSSTAADLNWEVVEALQLKHAGLDTENWALSNIESRTNSLHGINASQENTKSSTQK